MAKNAHQILVAFNAVLITGAPAYAQLSTVPDGELQDLSPSLAVSKFTAEAEQETRISILVGPDEVQAAEPEAPPADGSDIRIGSVLIETSPGIDHAIFEKTIEPFLGLYARGEDLSRLAQEIADVARAEGMVLATARVPRQQVELGIVRVELMIGVIDEVRIEGASNKALRDLLEPLVGQVVVQRELERRLMLANDIPAIQTKKAELLNEAGRCILVVMVEERAKTGGQIAVDNFGSKVVGPLRGRLNLKAVSILDASDSLNIMFQANPADPNELLAGSLAYSVGLNNNGSRAGAVIAASKVSIPSSLDFERRDISSQYVSMVINHPLRRLRGSNAWLEGQIEYLAIEQERLDVLFASDTIVTLSASLASSLKVNNGWLRAGAQLRQGLDMLGANETGNPLSSRYDADGQYTSARAWITWFGKPAGNWTLSLALSGQLANEPLLSPEEIGLGGAYVGRGFEPYTLSGDQGMLAFAEFGYEYSNAADWLDRLQPYAFLDGGYVDQLDDGLGGGGLMSSGGGVRAEIGRVGLQLETAVPVYQSGPEGTKIEPKVNFQLGLDF